MEHVVAADAVESRRTVSCRRRLLRTSLTWPLLLSTLTQLLRGRATKRCHYSYVEKSATLMQLLRGGATLFTYAALTGSTSLGTASFAWEQPEKIQRNTLVEKNTVQYCSHKYKYDTNTNTILFTQIQIRCKYKYNIVHTNTKEHCAGEEHSSILFTHS